VKQSEYLNEVTTPRELQSRKLFSDMSNPSMTELVGWFQTKYPELTDAMKASDHAVGPGEVNVYHVEGSVWTHTMMVCQQAQCDHIVNKLSALFHDLGKPMAREVIPLNTPKPSINGEERSTTKPLEDPGSGMHVHMRGHEGISTWLAIDPLIELQMLGIIAIEEMEEILTIISLHGTLFNRINENGENKPEKVVNQFDSYEKFARFVKQSKNDSLGRFYKRGVGSRADVASSLGDTIFNEDTFYENKSETVDKGDVPTINVLVGLPACGKSSFVKDKFPGTVVISKDVVIMEMGEELGMTDYSHIYKTLTKEQHKEAYAITMERFKQAKADKVDMVIDMTNMSKKSRNKWIHDAGNRFKTKAWVFATGQSSLVSRNIIRSQTENKWIPNGVYENMMKTYLVPTTYEFDEVEYIFQHIS